MGAYFILLIFDDFFIKQMTEDFLTHCDCAISAPLPAEFVRKLTHSARLAWQVKNRNFAKWDEALRAIEKHPKGTLSFQNPYLQITTPRIHQSTLKQSLQTFIPWRKGPFRINTLAIESEWRGDLKWQRLTPHIRTLHNKTVLDVGAGNGYFTLQMALAGAKLALGVEPFLLFNYQFQAIKTLIQHPPNAFILPLRLEAVENSPVFDTIFSMGVLYHQRDPNVHLRQLKGLLKRDGELILETLIIDAQHGDCLIPTDRYAKMRNVWHLPSTRTVQNWLNTAGFQSVKLVDENQTSIEEQRATEWIGDNSASLKDFLQTNNPNLTIEGHPAPRRAIFICRH